jgi:hypothetical protein
VLWLVALLAAVAGFPYGLIPMLISVPVLLVHFKLRERAERREIALGYRRFDGSLRSNPAATRENDGGEIHYSPRNFTPEQPEQLMDNLVPSRYYAHLYERHATKAEQMFQRFMPEI